MTRTPRRAPPVLARLLPRLTVAATAALALLSSPTGARRAWAQAVEGFALDRFNPSSPGSDWFALDSLDLRGQLRPALRLGLDWAHKPLVLFDRNDKEIAAIVERQIFLHVGLAVTFVDRLRVGVNMPFAVDQVGNEERIGTFTFASPGGASLGDLRAALDLRVFGVYGGPITLAIGSEVFFPTGKQDHYAGEGQVRAAPRLQLAGDVGMLAYALKIGFSTRTSIDDRMLQGVNLGHELVGGLALGLRPIESLLVGPELFGSSTVTEGHFLEKRATPLELIFGAQLTVARDWRLAAGVGPGLTQGLGAPTVRVLARVEYFPAPPPPDRDGDKILDAEDACPDVPGIRTDDPRTNGCPDKDRDGILDHEDACPLEPGVRTNDPRTNGCPPPRDRDKDGVLDRDDACPDVPGEKTDDPKTNGCPPPDRDKDGILDREDACPDKPGDKTDNPKTNGCPDTDKDGILDPEDACPDLPGPRDPDPKKNGCPVARVDKGQIKITQQIKFKTGSAVILPESDSILEAVAGIMKEHPEIKKIRIEGHTDNRGGRAYNLGLSRRRAASVVKWLTTIGGIEKSRMTSEGYGFERPLEDNATEEGRRENRRVEFHIVEPPPQE
jgi:outer membrane protein OmpA-like peptidoglycan-associated protein